MIRGGYNLLWREVFRKLLDPPTTPAAASLIHAWPFGAGQGGSIRLKGQPMGLRAMKLSYRFEQTSALRPLDCPDLLGPRRPGTYGILTAG